MLVSHEDNKSSRGSIDGPLVHVVVSPMSCVFLSLDLSLSPPESSQRHQQWNEGLMRNPQCCLVDAFVSLSQIPTPLDQYSQLTSRLFASAVAISVSFEGPPFNIATIATRK